MINAKIAFWAPNSLLAAPSNVLILMDGTAGVVVFGLNWIGVLEEIEEIWGGGKVLVVVTWLVDKVVALLLVTEDLATDDGEVIVLVAIEETGLVTVSGLVGGTVTVSITGLEVDGVLTWLVELVVVKDSLGVVEVLVVVTSFEELGLATDEDGGGMKLVPVETWHMSEEHSVIVVKMVVK